MKRSKFNILMALFVALSVVPACGEDSNNQNPAEGEGEGETDSGTPEPDSGEGEGEGGNDCERCLAACNGDVGCEMYCYPTWCQATEGEGEGDQCVAGDCEYACNGDTQCIQACPICAEGEGEGADVCDGEGAYGYECQQLMLAEYAWLNGRWQCDSGPACEDHPIRTVTVDSWDPELKAALVTNFLNYNAVLNFTKDDDGKFNVTMETDRETATGMADQTSGIFSLEVHGNDDGAGQPYVQHYSFHKE